MQAVVGSACGRRVVESTTFDVDACQPASLARRRRQGACAWTWRRAEERAGGKDFFFLRLWAQREPLPVDHPDCLWC